MIFYKDKVLIKQINLSSSEVATSNDSFHMSYGIDRNFLYGSGISIESILKNNPFIDMKNESPWKGIRRLQAQNSNHLRYCAKHYFINKNTL